jgi:3-phenylpropionate/cinnamic acid dioxygenase small subunit
MENHVVDDATGVERQVTELVARNAITELVYRLGVALDDGRFDELRSIFTEDSTASTPGGSVEGIDALIAQASRNHSRERRNHHVITNVLIDLDGERADVRANLVVTFARDAVPYFTLGEVYRFDARRTPDGWRLSRVESTPVWSTGSRDGA